MKIFLSPQILMRCFVSVLRILYQCIDQTFTPTALRSSYGIMSSRGFHVSVSIVSFCRSTCIFVKFIIVFYLSNSARLFFYFSFSVFPFHASAYCCTVYTHTYDCTHRYSRFKWETSFSLKLPLFQ